jgi:DNA polymerase III delta prime subunit
MTQLVLHPLTEQQLAAFTDRPPHALLLVGPSGVGKSSLSELLAESILELKSGGLVNYPYKLRLGEAEATSIGIEAVRELEHFLSLRVPGDKEHNRVVLIEDGDRLTIEAQNALLKTLEEPPAGTIIIMTARHEKGLLPTIVSRVQLLPVRRPVRAELEEHFRATSTPDKLKQAYMMSGGLPGLMHALVNDADHPLLAAAQSARQLLSQTTYERLLRVDELAKDKAGTQNILIIMQQMAHISLQSAQGQAAHRWRAVLEACYEAHQALNESGQPKLVLTKLMLAL